MKIKMKHTNVFMAMAAVLMCVASLASCSSGKSYAQLLNEENMHVNSFLADQRVVGFADRDSTFNFEVGVDAPYYQMDEDGNIYMQVLNAGTAHNYADTDQLIYFRFTRYNLEDYDDGALPEGEGNDSDMSTGSTSFRFNNFTSSASYQWGEGIQTPLMYLPIDCEVNLVIKSQFGIYSEIANVTPYLYNVRYFKSQI